MRLSMTLLCAAAAGLAACNPADTSGNATNAEAESVNAAGNASGGAPAADSNAATAAAAQTGEGGSEPVSFRGCPILRDVEGGCLVVQSGGVTYDINSARPRPDPVRRLIIEGTGVPGGVSICMTGTPLSDIKWQYTKAKCSENE